ncbi:P-loop containing nucleoside triphosphate hydrolase protein, partial [Pavlovales sp. CCMP2436]
EFRVRAASDAGADALRGVPDLLQLSDFSEPSLLHTLRVRYERDEVYTFVGTILISINPYRWVDSLYDLRSMLSYRNAPLGERPPHLYAVADVAY